MKFTDPIIGNTTIIYSAIFNELSYDEIRKWRMLSYSNLSSNLLIKRSNLDQIRIENDYNMRSIILREKIITNSISFKDITFVSFDSSYICNPKINIMSIINNLKGTVILVDTYISYIECMFKLSNPKKTSKHVDLNNVRKYVSLFDNKIFTNNKNIKHLHKMSFNEANKYLYFYEKKFYEANGHEKLCKGLRNELNDDAMVHMLGIIKNTYYGSNVVLYTLDKTMADKCEDVGIKAITTV